MGQCILEEKGAVKMNQEQIGKLIAQCRKENNLTQAGLAEKLHITDQTVSKWETGKSMPDAAIMLELCGILGITVNELLSGERIDMETCEKKADENPLALQQREESHMVVRNTIIYLLFPAAFLIGIVVCVICDVAISGGFTWSPIPVSSILLAWLTVFPIIIWGKKGILRGLCILSVFILPYLYLLSRLLGVKEVFSIGAVMAAISIPFVWILFAVFRYAAKKRRKAAALGISFLLAVPFMLAVNLILSKMLAEPVLDIWDGLSVLVLLLLAFQSFLYDYVKQKGLLQ